jgi:hypothetical protein
MSLAKVAPDGLKDREFKKMTLRERPTIPYAFVIHVGSAREAIKKKGYFKSFEEHSDEYSEKREKVEELRKQLEALKEALAAQPQEAAPKGTTAEAHDDSSATLHVETKAELKQSTLVAKEAVDLRDKAALDMFQLYANLLSVDARYAWNKIVQEQTEADPYQDLQGLNSLGAISDWRQKKNRCSYFSSRYVPHFNVGIVRKSYERKKQKKTRRAKIYLTVRTQLTFRS